MEAPREDSSIELARQAFEEGAQFARQGQWPEALARFEKSSELRAHPVTTYNIAYVERALGHYTRARKAFRRALEEHEPEALPEDLATEAREYLAEVEQKLARVTVSIRGARAALSVDGRPLEVETAGGARPLLVAGTLPNGSPESPPGREFDLLVDPGAHVVLMTAPDGRERVSNRKVSPAERARWVLEMPHLEPPAKPTSAAIAPPDAPPERASRRGWAYVAFGAAAAGFGVTAIFGLMALDDLSELEDECAVDGGCPPAQQETLDDFHTHTTLANIGLAVGIVGAGLGTYLWLTEPEQETGPSARAYVGPASIGVRGRF